MALCDPYTAFFLTSVLLSSVQSSPSVIDDLNNLQPHPDFSVTISNNCLKNPSLRYCSGFFPTDLPDIFKATIVADHLCNESNNNNCNGDSFTKIDLRNRPKITPLYLSFAFFWKYCPLTVLVIDLSNNSIKGNFPTDILKCTQVQSLDLSHNNFNGEFPMKNFSLLNNLTLLILSYNHFSELPISDAHFLEQFGSSSFLHSGLLPNHRKFKIKATFFLVGFPIFVILTVVSLGWICFWRPDFLPPFLRHQHKFTPSMLKAATSGFSQDNLVAKLAELDIYRGKLRDGTEVRIEIYQDKITPEQRKEFVEECRVLVQLDHKNLVRVLGWCDRRNPRAIVTEWSNGMNLVRWLSQSPSWNKRLKVLVSVVEGMCYLKDQWPGVVCDLKASSVLLSEDQEPLISRLWITDQNNYSRMVYMFGVLMLEMIVTRSSPNVLKEGKSIVEWVRMHYPGNIWVVMDARIKKSGMTYEQASQMVDLGLMCTHLSDEQQLPNLHHISKTVKRVYEASIVLGTPNHEQWHSERD
ncbi:hypothetical protein C5167_036731 [Papaver somniferum]|uniref:Protein kinase domain-containing protein n=1 Tax=Papaver somniferum TaxID=3469 RepID=A0A4Y7I4U2_PAPSO|nr:probable LRR receptor-like serine/threonine-protein kinase At2g23950 isoform X1 [Papaver somniferum]RZC43784.1 hypothetical protein C5167_036731 [Papaver somniferum]